MDSDFREDLVSNLASEIMLDQPYSLAGDNTVSRLSVSAITKEYKILYHNRQTTSEVKVAR